MCIKETKIPSGDINGYEAYLGGAEVLSTDDPSSSSSVVLLGGTSIAGLLLEGESRSCRSCSAAVVKGQ